MPFIWSNWFPVVAYFMYLEPKSWYHQSPSHLPWDHLHLYEWKAVWRSSIFEDVNQPFVKADESSSQRRITLITHLDIPRDILCIYTKYRHSQYISQIVPTWYGQIPWDSVTFPWLLPVRDSLPHSLKVKKRKEEWGRANYFPLLYLEFNSHVRACLYDRANWPT